MTKKSAKAKAGKAAAKEKVNAKDVMKMPSEATVRSVASDMASTRKSKGKLSEELREVVAAAKKDKGLHPAALRLVEGWIFKAKNTDRGLAAIATMLAHVDFYRDVLGLDELLKKQGQMFARPEAGEKVPDAKLPLAEARETEEKAGATTLQ